jgi:hypothetical protein
MEQRMPNNDGTFLVEGAQFLYRTNFRGEPEQYNERGDRVFNLKLPEELARQLMSDGWNVKMSKPRKDAKPEEIEEFVSEPYMEVKLGYKVHPPRVVMIGDKSGKRTELGEDTVSVLDEMEYANIDLVVRPREYDINGKQGIRAYLKTMYVTIVEDDLDLKYADD